MLSVLTCKTLADHYVVQVVLEVCAIQVAKVVRYICILLLPLESLERSLDLLLSSCSLVLLDDLITLCEVLFFAVIQVDSQLLVKLRNLLTEIS